MRGRKGTRRNSSGNGLKLGTFSHLASDSECSRIILFLKNNTGDEHSNKGGCGFSFNVHIAYLAAAGTENVCGQGNVFFFLLH